MTIALETLLADGEVAAYILRGQTGPNETMFPLPDHLNLQVGLIGRRAGELVEPHRHHPIERNTRGTMEALVMRQGRCVLDVYDSRDVRVASSVLAEGDVVLLPAGGHGMRMLEDTVLLEVKQGPYNGAAEKQRFKAR